MSYELYRDDDIGVHTDIGLFMRVHELFLKHNQVHRIAVLMENFWENREVWYYILSAPNLEIALHGRWHRDYGQVSYNDCLEDIRWSLETWKARVARGGYAVPVIEVFHPPWHSVGPALSAACEKYGLVLDSRRGGSVYNFHYWACLDPKRMADLERALQS